jgi:type II secretory pathway component PulF
MFSSSLPSAALADWCRALRHQLSAGVSVTKTLNHAATSGATALREMSSRLLRAAQAGRPLAPALEADADRMPPVFVPLFRVGEEAGRLPEVLADLEEYLRQDDRLRRQFRQQTLLPRIQLFLAIFIVAGLIWILGTIAGSRGGSPISIFGLAGTSGALIFLAVTLGPIMVVWLIAKKLGGAGLRGRFDAILLRLPVIGPVLEAIALQRFSLALGHTLDSNMPIAKAVGLGFDATGNAAFQAQSSAVAAALKSGATLAEALGPCPLLPPVFVEIIETAEHGGVVPEAMRQQAKHYQELAGERLKRLSQVASFGVWLLVATFIVICIFRIANIYLSALGV